MIVVDFGSSDDSVKIAENCEVRVLEFENGRGYQLQVGAKLIFSGFSCSEIFFINAKSANNA